MALSIDWAAKVISVPKADTTLVSPGPPEIRSYDIFEVFFKELIALLATEDGMPFVDAQRHFTSVTVGGVSLAHVIEVINGYTVTFEDGFYQVNTGGANHNILDVANLNSVGLRSSNSGGLIATEIGKQTKNLQYLIESQRASSSAFGKVFYWDPVNGDDTKGGDSTETAVSTFAAAHDLVTANSADVIFVINTTGAELVITERLVITKNDCILRGPGTSIKIAPTDDTAPAITVNAHNVELSGLAVQTSGATPQDVVCVGNFDRFLLRDFSIIAGTGNGVSIAGGEDHKVLFSDISRCAGDGINLTNAVRAQIMRNRIQRNTGSGVCLIESAGTHEDTWIAGNVFHHNGPGSINIGAGVSMTIISKDNYFGPPPGTPGGDDIVDNGTSTHNEYEEFTRKVLDIWQLQGLDASNPMTVTDAQRAVDAITQTISDDGTTTTVTRS